MPSIIYNRKYQIRIRINAMYIYVYMTKRTLYVSLHKIFIVIKDGNINTQITYFDFITTSMNFIFKMLQ